MTLQFGGRSVETLRVGYTAEVESRTGGAALRVPVALPSGRNALGPALALSYSSGSGNSAFGLGWSLAGLSAIRINTRLHLPRWDGSDGFEIDGEELVPWLEETPAGWTPRGSVEGDWSVAFLRRRRGGPQLRVERWLHVPTGRVHFRARDAHNVVTVYGARPSNDVRVPAASRIADPSGEERTFAWLPEVQLDSRGNAVWFEYDRETLAGVELGAPYERREPALAQRYLKRILYGNASPVSLTDSVVDGIVPSDVRWCFQVLLDYGDLGGADALGIVPGLAWPARKDPFSNSRQGFELRTFRLCRRVLVLHDFQELGSGPTLVSALVLRHNEDPAGATLNEIVSIGYRRDGAAVTSKTLPPLKLAYAEPMTETFFAEASPRAQENVPAGLAARRYSFVDLLGEGLAGILTEDDSAWYYKPNLGGGEFDAQTVVLERPATRRGAFALGDMDRDGDTDLSQLSGRLAGLYEFDREEAVWRAFRPFAAFPHVEALGGKAQWVDLNGDGRADIVIAKAESFVWFASDGEEFLSPVEVPRPGGAQGIPTLAADPMLDLFFADMTGDGLVDLVCVRNGRVEYWPSLGNGRFSDSIVMEDVPWFAPEGEFDAARLRFVDLDGSGASDIIYIGRGEVSCWLNASGNRLVAGPRRRGLPFIDNASNAQVLDFLGDGSTCLVWSSRLPGPRGALEYLQLTPARQPRLLVEVDDSLGCKTSFVYSSSSLHYRRDVASGRNWSTRLPTHHPVVDLRQVLDQIGNTRAVQRFEYHDGYYDGVEREQRGFGQVDVYDAETVQDTSDPRGAAFTAPALNRTWFHLGTPMWGHHLPAGIYAGDAELPVLPAHVVDDAERMTAEEIEDGLRALAGRTLRREVYSVDDGVPGAHPFEVYQASFRLRRMQPALLEQPGAFSGTELQEATWTYEQEPADPRVQHKIVVESDAFDAPVRVATIGYPRRSAHPVDVAAQRALLVTIEDHGVSQESHAVINQPINFDQRARFELAIVVEHRSCELAGARPSRGPLFTRDDFRSADTISALASPGANHIALVADPTLGVRARLLTRTKTFYWDDPFAAALPFGEVGALPLPHHEETACFATGFISAALLAPSFGQLFAEADLGTLSYSEQDGAWWQVDATQHYAAEDQFRQLLRIERGDHAVTQFLYDDYCLNLTGVIDALGNQSGALIDYHELAPWQLTDPNHNVQEVRYDPLGVVIATTSYGHVNDQAWGFDALAPGVADAVPTALGEALANPAQYVQGVASYVWYDLNAWSNRSEPPLVLTLTREELVNDGAGHTTRDGRVQVGISYLDGLGRVLQQKQLVEPDQAIVRNGNGVVLGSDERPLLAPAAPRWRSSGHVIYDAKQQACRQYEPYFTPSSAYENTDVTQHVGVATLTRYDALGRAAAQQFPNLTYSTTTFHAWSVEQADPNDNVQNSGYRLLRQSLGPNDPERQAYEKALRHAGTPTTTFLDALGREVGTRKLAGAQDPPPQTLTTESRLDIQGNAREVIDPRGLTAFAYERDMQGRVIRQHSIDAGDAWSLPDAYGRGVRAWNALGFELRTDFDVSDRPTALQVTPRSATSAGSVRVEEWFYGESLQPTEAARRNLLGRVVTNHDSAGELAVDAYDPAGRVLGFARNLCTDRAESPNWDHAINLESDPLTRSATTYDALGRPTSELLPGGAVRSFSYLPSGGLARVALTMPDGALVDQPILVNATYTARGERERAELGNHVQLSYGYNSETHRLETQTATFGDRSLQSLRYTYDPVGNITCLRDAAQDGTAALGRGAPSARRDYDYDAYYRLREATGRVHQALTNFDFVPPGDGSTNKATRQLGLNDGTAVTTYRQSYEYDASGNLLALRHVGTGAPGSSPRWTTQFVVDPLSNRSLPEKEPDRTTLTAADLPGRFDAAGNVTQLAHLRSVEWSWRGTLERCVVIHRPGGSDDAERYVYGADSQRVLKISTRVYDGDKLETIEKAYFGDAERKRITRAGILVLERWTTHVRDGDQRIALVHQWSKDDLKREIDTLPPPTDTARATRTHYLLNTHQGSSAFELDENANTISYEEYFPHGGTAFIAGDDARGVTRKEYRYSGKECDDVTSLYYYGYRYYAPWMGRWVSADPIGPEDDLNLYQFVFGNPVTHMDPTGLQSGDARRRIGDTTARTAVQAMHQFNATTGLAEGVEAVEMVAVGNDFEIRRERSIAAHLLDAQRRLQSGNQLGRFQGVFGETTDSPAPSAAANPAFAMLWEGAPAQGYAALSGGEGSFDALMPTGSERHAQVSNQQRSAPGSSERSAEGGTHHRRQTGGSTTGRGGTTGRGERAGTDPPSTSAIGTPDGHGSGAGTDPGVRQGVGIGGGAGSRQGNGSGHRNSRSSARPNAILPHAQNQVTDSRTPVDGSAGGHGSDTALPSSGADPRLTPSATGDPPPSGIIRQGDDPNGSLNGARTGRIGAPGLTGQLNGHGSGTSGGTELGGGHDVDNHSVLQGGSPGGTSTTPEGILDTVTRWAGYANMEFDGGTGRSGGIAGGKGTHHGAGWQILSIALTVASFVGPEALLNGACAIGRRVVGEAGAVLANLGRAASNVLRTAVRSGTEAGAREVGTAAGAGVVAGITRASEGGETALHHVLPQEFEVEFERILKGTGENIHDFAVRMPRSLHDALHSGSHPVGNLLNGRKRWNDEWLDFLYSDSSHLPSASEVRTFAADLMHDFGLDVHLPFVRYH